MTSNSCCCETVMFDGSCFDAEKKLIAFCVQSISETTANCYENADRDGDSFTCHLGDACPTTSRVSAERIFVTVGIIVGGLVGLVIVLMLIIVLIYGFYTCLKCMKGRVQEEQPRTEIETPPSEDDSRENTKPSLWSRFRALLADDERSDDKDENPEGKGANIENDDESPEGEDQGRKKKESLFWLVLSLMSYESLILGGIERDYETTLIVIGASVAIIAIFLVLYQYIKFEKPMDDERRKELYNSDAATLETEPSDMYDDITTPFDRVVLLFVCQTTLLGVYIYAIYTAGSPDFSSDQAYVFYTLGALVQISYQYAKSPLFRQIANLVNFTCKGNEENRTKKQEHWDKILAAQIGGTVYFNDVTSGSERHIDKRSLRARRIMSSIVNDLGSVVLFFLLPLHLSHSVDATTFVLNVTAAYYIIELDDDCASEKIELCIKRVETSDGKVSEQSYNEAEMEKVNEDTKEGIDGMGEPCDEDPPKDKHEKMVEDNSIEVVAQISGDDASNSSAQRLEIKSGNVDKSMPSPSSTTPDPEA